MVGEKSEFEAEEELLQSIGNVALRDKCRGLLQVGREIRLMQRTIQAAREHIAFQFKRELGEMTMMWVGDASTIPTHIRCLSSAEEVSNASPSHPSQILQTIKKKMENAIARRIAEVELFDDRVKDEVIQSHCTTKSLQLAIGTFKTMRSEIERFQEEAAQSGMAKGGNVILSPVERRRSEEQGESYEDLVVPFQVLFSDVTYFNESTQSFDVRMEVGDVLNRDGKSLVTELCASCGYTIQKGRWQEGERRYRCVDCPDRVFCVACFETTKKWIDAAQEVISRSTSPSSLRAGVDLRSFVLKQVNMCVEHYAAQEYEIPTFAAIEASKEPNLRRKFNRRFQHLYPERPCFALPLRNPLDEAEAVSYLSFKEVWTLVKALEQSFVRRLTASYSSSSSTGLSLDCRQSSNIAILLSQSPTAYLAAFAAMSMQVQFTILEPTWPMQDVLHCCRLLGSSTCETDSESRFLLVLDDVTAALFAETSQDIQCLLATCAIRIIVHDYPTDTGFPSGDLQRFGDAVVVPAVSSLSANIDLSPLRLGDEVMDDSNLPVCVIFSSGSSGGAPKGVVMRVGMIYKEISLPLYDLPLISVSKSSPAWATDQRTVMHTLFFGGRLGFVPRRSSSFIVFDFLKRFRPTMFVSFVPAQAEMLVEIFRQRVMEGNRKQAAEHEARVLADAVEECYQLIGGRVASIGIGGAAVKDHLLEQLRSFLPCDVVETYGITECGGIGSSTDSATGNLQEVTTGTAGFGGLQVGKGIEWQLRDVDGFTSTDKPFPRGELWLRSDYNVALDDFICDDQVKEQVKLRFSSDGFVNSGDLAEAYPDGTIGIVGRSSALIKLPNGQFMSPEQVEDAIGILPNFQGTFVDVLVDGRVGILLEGCPLGVDDEGDASAAHAESAMRSKAMEALKEARQRCASRGIPAAWSPTAVIVELSSAPQQERNNSERRSLPNSWLSRGLCTSTLKLSRPKLRRYLADITRQGPGGSSSSWLMLTCEEVALLVEAATTGSRHSFLSPLEKRAFGLLQSAGVVVAASNNGEDDEDSAKSWLALVRSLLRSPLQRVGVDSVRLAKLLVSVNRKLLHSSQSVSADQLTAMELAEALDSSLSSSLPFQNVDEGTPIDTIKCGELSAPDLATNHPEDGMDFVGHCFRVLKLQPADLGDVSKLTLFLRKIEDYAVGYVKRSAESYLSASASSSRRRGDGGGGAVLLVTGSTGFLGSFVVAQLLQSSWVAKIFCIARGTSNCHASERVLAAVRKIISQAGSTIVAPALEKAKLIVFAGDCAQKNFGLLPACYDELVGEVSGIVHIAALVKSWSVVRGLPSLLKENLGGCLRVAEFALLASCSTLSPISIVYTSTLSVNPAVGSKCSDAAGGRTTLWNFSVADESPDVIRSLSAYALAKAIGEIALREAVCQHKRIVQSHRADGCNGAVTLDIYRPCLLTGSQSIRNPDDWFCRFIDTVLELKLAPILCQKPTASDDCSNESISDLKCEWQSSAAGGEKSDRDTSPQVLFDKMTPYCSVEQCARCIVHELSERLGCATRQPGEHKDDRSDQQQDSADESLENIRLVIAPRYPMSLPLPSFRMSHVLRELHRRHPNLRFVPIHAFAQVCQLVKSPPPFYTLVYEMLGSSKPELLMQSERAAVTQPSYARCSVPQL